MPTDQSVGIPGQTGDGDPPALTAEAVLAALAGANGVVVVNSGAVSVVPFATAASYFTCSANGPGGWEAITGSQSAPRKEPA
jgi:hypothetical protein